MQYGYMGKLLRVNLTQGSMSEQELSEDLARGYLGGSGTKAGILTLALPIIVMIAIPLAFPNVDWAASTMPEVEGVGPINATMAALTNGLIRSTWGIAHGLAAISSAIGGIITLIILIMIPILIAFGLALTAVLGFIGGKLGSTIARSRIDNTSRPNVPLTHQNQPQLPSSSSSPSPWCWAAMCCWGWLYLSQ